MADRLTLEAFGVDRGALARRIDDRQTELGRDDAACAQLAGVTIERWQAWKRKDDPEMPGVARVPKLAAALDVPASWVLYGTGSEGVSRVEIAERSTERTRTVLDVLTRLTPSVDTIEQLAEEIARLKLPIPGGAVMGVALERARDVLRTHDAVTLIAGAAE